MSVGRALGEARDAAAVGVSRLGLGLRLRAPIVGGVVLALLASFAAGGVPLWIVPALFIASALVTAVRPDTHVGLAVLVTFGWYWLAHVDDGASPWTMVATAGLFVFHLATSAAALGPAEVELPRTLLVRWIRRAVPMLGGAVAVWLFTAVVGSADLPSNVVLTAAALVVVAAGAWFALSHSQPSDAVAPREAPTGRPPTP